MKPWKHTGRQVGAASLSLLLLAGVTAPQAAAAVSPVVDEAYYGTLDYYGGLTQGGVVKSYRTNGNTVIHDTGVYDEVVNLTDRTEPVRNGDQVTFDLGEDAPANFYFEGKTPKPYQEMPFKINLSYKMNGLESEPENMAGEKGVGEVLLDVTPNTGASEYARNNFVLLAMTMLRDRDILSVEAEGAQVQKLGDMVAVVYAVMPGEEQHFDLRIGTEDFSFSGFTFLVQPATLAQLDQLADLREAKDTLEDSYNSIIDSINIILNSVDGLDSKLNYTADGLDQLNQARATISGGKNRVYDEADRTLAAMTDVSNSLKPVVDHIKTAKDAIAETNDQLQTLSSSVDDVRPEVKAIKGSLGDVQKDLEKLNKALNDGKTDSESLQGLMADLQKDVKNLRTDLGNVQDETDNLSKAMNDLKNVKFDDISSIDVEGKTVAQIKESKKVADGILLICKGIAAEGREDAPTTETGYAEFVKNHRNWVARQLVEQQAADSTSEVAKTIAAAEKQAAEAAQDAGRDEKAQEAAKQQAREKVLEGAAEKVEKSQLTDSNIDSLAKLEYTDDLESQLREVETFNGMIGDANKGLDKAETQIKNVAGPTKDLLDALSDLTGTINSKNGLLVHTQDVLSKMESLLNTANGYDNDALHDDVSGLLTTTQTLLDKTDTVLEQSKSLTDTISKYEPDAQAGLDDATKQINASVKLLDNINTFSKTVENLMRAAGGNLDQGANKSLTGLSDSLRQMSDGLGGTDSIRSANNAIQDVIEDKWDEYTGEKNNMLNMDSQAEMQSLTSNENQTPTSVQLVLRSQEIKVDKDKADRDAAGQQKTTVWQRIGRMFKDFGAIFTGD